MEKTLQNYLYELELKEEVQNSETVEYEIELFNDYERSVAFLKEQGITEEELQMELDW